MAIDEELRATIVRLSRAEGWPVGTIARHLGIHHSTVTRALRARGGQQRRARPKLIDPFIPFIRKQLKENADLPASTLYGQVEARGYRGGEDHFRHSLRALGLRPVKRSEPSMRLRFLAAEQAQVDWAEFGKVRIGRAERKLMGLLVTLSYSRQTFLSLFYNAQMSSFLHGHVEAFEAFGGVPRRLLYDNLTCGGGSRGRMPIFQQRLRDQMLPCHTTMLIFASRTGRSRFAGTGHGGSLRLFRTGRLRLSLTRCRRVRDIGDAVEKASCIHCHARLPRCASDTKSSW